MTRKQMEALEKMLPSWNERNEEQRMLYEEISCREMINSCLIYGARFFEWYANNYIKKLWEEKVKELYEDQLKDFKQAIVKPCVYTDWEGCTYNTITWADEM